MDDLAFMVEGEKIGCASVKKARQRVPHPQRMSRIKCFLRAQSNFDGHIFWRSLPIAQKWVIEDSVTHTKKRFTITKATLPLCQPKESPVTRLPHPLSRPLPRRPPQRTHLCLILTNRFPMFISLTMLPVSPAMAPNSSKPAGIEQRMLPYTSSTLLWVKINSTTARC